MVSPISARRSGPGSAAGRPGAPPRAHGQAPLAAKLDEEAIAAAVECTGPVGVRRLEVERRQLDDRIGIPDDEVELAGGGTQPEANGRQGLEQLEEQPSVRLPLQTLAELGQVPGSEQQARPREVDVLGLPSRQDRSRREDDDREQRESRQQEQHLGPPIGESRELSTEPELGRLRPLGSP